MSNSGYTLHLSVKTESRVMSLKNLPLHSEYGLRLVSIENESSTIWIWPRGVLKIEFLRREKKEGAKLEIFFSHTALFYPELDMLFPSCVSMHYDMNIYDYSVSTQFLPEEETNAKVFCIALEFEGWADDDGSFEIPVIKPVKLLDLLSNTYTES